MEEHIESPVVQEILRRRRRIAIARWIGTGMLIAAGVAFLVMYPDDPAQPTLPEALPPAPVAAPPVPIAVRPPAPPTARPAKPTPPSTAVSRPELPPLGRSDPLVRQRIRGLSERLSSDPWLDRGDLVRLFTVAVVNVAEGQTPRKQLADLAPSEPFATVVEDERILIDPETYRRYDTIAEAFVSLNTQASVEFFRDIRPLVVEAYGELGYPDRVFEDDLNSAIDELLAVPVLDADLELSRRTVGYEYIDSDLEALSPAQKQLLRMGPRNVRLIQAKLLELSTALGVM